LPIHPTAIVDPAAELDHSVEVGPYAIIDGPVKIGAGTRIWPHAHVQGHTVIGRDNEIHTGAVVGAAPQHLAYKGAPSGLRIGDRNVFREYVTIHRAYHEGHETVVGDENYLMAAAHIGHDCRVGNNCILANSCMLGGHVLLENNTNLSGNVAAHQFVRVGRLAMVGGGVKIIKDVPPFMLVERWSEVYGLNTVGIRRAGYDLPTRNQIKAAYRVLYRSGLNVPQAVAELEKQFPDVAPVQELITFIRNSVRGICRHAAIKHGASETEE